MPTPNDNMKVSKIGADLIKGFEALAFLCPDGKIRSYNAKGCNKSPEEWTIGFGLHSGTTATSIYNNEQEAIDHYYKRVQTYGSRVIDALKKFNVQKKLKQNEFDALVDVAYHKGNCYDLASKLSKNGGLTESDFINTTSAGHAGRRSKDYKLWKGESVNVGTYGIYVNKENDNQGWCHYTKKEGGKSYSSPAGGYGEDMALDASSGSGTLGDETSQDCKESTGTNTNADSRLLSNEISGRQDLLDQSKLKPVGSGYREHPKDPNDFTGQYMIAPAADDFNRMVAAAKKAGFTITPQNSTFRSYKKQKELWDKPHTPGSVATPGHSRHGWGRAVDIDELSDGVGTCPAGKAEKLFEWLKANADSYNFFHPSFAAKNCFEPWHWEYDGVDENPAVAGSSSGGVADAGYNNSSGFKNCRKDNTGAGQQSDKYTVAESISQWKNINDIILGTGTGKLADLVDGPSTTKKTNATASTKDEGMKTIIDPKHTKDDVVVGKEDNNTKDSNNEND